MVQDGDNLSVGWEDMVTDSGLTRGSADIL